MLGGKSNFAREKKHSHRVNWIQLHFARNFQYNDSSFVARSRVIFFFLAFIPSHFIEHCYYRFGKLCSIDLIRETSEFEGFAWSRRRISWSLRNVRLQDRPREAFAKCSSESSEKLHVFTLKMRISWSLSVRYQWAWAEPYGIASVSQESTIIPEQRPIQIYVKTRDIS